MSDKDDFEDQLRQEAESAQREEELAGRTRVDPDGTVYEWDPHQRAWFPKIDADFIAKYQMNYGADTTETETSTTVSIATNTTTTDTKATDATSTAATDYYSYYSSGHVDTNSEEYRKYYKEYCEHYSTQGSSEDAVEGRASTQYTSYEDYVTHYRQYYGQDPPDDEEAFANYYSQYLGESAQKDEAQEEKVEEPPEKPPEKASEKSGKDKGTKRNEKVEWFDVDPSKTNTVYVSGLPDDTTEDEFKTMMQKCGLITLDPIGRTMKVKLYTDAEGNNKGDGRCCYIKSESVDLALQLVDGSELRGHTIHVERAQFNLKGAFDPSRKRRKLTSKQKRKFIERQEKLFDWRPDQPVGERPRSQRVVVIEQAFSPSEFDVDPAQINILRTDLQSECAKFGDVRKVTVYDRSPLGVATVTMTSPEEADVVVEAINGRWFGGRQLNVHIWDGRTKYEVKETEAEMKKRDDQWHKFLNQPTDKPTDQAARPESERRREEVTGGGEEVTGGGHISLTVQDKEPPVEAKTESSQEQGRMNEQVNEIAST